MRASIINGPFFITRSLFLIVLILIVRDKREREMEKSSLGNFRLLCIENLWRFLLGLRLSFSIFFFFIFEDLFARKSKFKAILLPFQFFLPHFSTKLSHLFLLQFYCFCISFCFYFNFQNSLFLHHFLKL